MIRRIKLPKVSANVEQATVTGWLKKEGDRVRKGEPLVELTTDKTCIEMESPVSGILRSILASEKSILPVGYIMALVGAADDVLPDVAKINTRLLLEHRQAATPTASAGRAARRRGGVRATPRARRIAREQGIDLAAVQKSTGAEVVTEEVIKAWAAGDKP